MIHGHRTARRVQGGGGCKNLIILQDKGREILQNFCPGNTGCVFVQSEVVPRIYPYPVRADSPLCSWNSYKGFVLRVGGSGRGRQNIPSMSAPFDGIWRFIVEQIMRTNARYRTVSPRMEGHHRADAL